MSTNRLSADARREQILVVAGDAFGRSGYHGASMNEIAEAAGVTKPVLYQHFDSKCDLYLALLETVGGRVLAVLNSARENADSGRSLTELAFEAYFRWVSEHPGEFALLFGGAARNNDEFSVHLARLSNEIAESVVSLIDVNLPIERRRTLAHGLIGMAENASRYLVNRGDDFDPRQISADIGSLAWAGLRSFDGVHDVGAQQGPSQAAGA